jgi:hypothetical protein
MGPANGHENFLKKVVAESLRFRFLIGPSDFPGDAEKRRS